MYQSMPCVSLFTEAGQSDAMAFVRAREIKRQDWVGAKRARTPTFPVRFGSLTCSQTRHVFMGSTFDGAAS